MALKSEKNIFPPVVGLPGMEINPTQEEIDAVGRKIAEGYLAPDQCEKLDLIPIRDAHGNQILDKEGKPVYKTDENGKPIFHLSYYDFGVQQDRVLWALGKAEGISDERKVQLRSVLSRFFSMDVSLPREAMALGLKIDQIMLTENPPKLGTDLIDRVKQGREWHLPVMEYLKRFIGNKLGRPDGTFSEFSALYEEGRISARLSDVTQRVASKLALMATVAEKKAFIEALKGIVEGS